MDERGEIVALQDRNAVIMVHRSDMCGKCGACEMGEQAGEMFLTIPNRLHGEVGDFVQLELASGQVLKASAIAYVFPLFALILGVMAGILLGPRYGLNAELTASILGLLFAGLSFLVIRGMEPHFKKLQHFSPQMVSVARGSKMGNQPKVSEKGDEGSGK